MRSILMPWGRAMGLSNTVSRAYAGWTVKRRASACRAIRRSRRGVTRRVTSLFLLHMTEPMSAVVFARNRMPVKQERDDCMFADGRIDKRALTVAAALAL